MILRSVSATTPPLPLVIVLALALPSLASVPTAEAQSTSETRPPDACGMTEADAQFGAIQPGAVVTLQRHRFVEGDDNWDEQMTRWLGRAARVTRLSGVDAVGCPGVRVDVDGGEYFWRARDLGIGTTPQRRTDTRIASASSFPQECGQDETRASYGPVAPGTEVTLGRHRAVSGDDNWTDEMEPYVGRRARIVELAGLDGVGCPGVRVDIDGQQWFWRVRDLRTGGSGAGAGGAGMVASSGVSSDHGRPAAVVAWGGGTGPDPAGGGTGGGLFGTGGSLPPQECGMTDATVQWGPIAPGTRVIIGRHRVVNGDENWSAEMDAFVGRPAQVADLIGVDDQGCPVVHIDADNGQFYWRVRDMTIP